jgi:Na+/H+ antiporter NhaC
MRLVAAVVVVLVGWWLLPLPEAARQSVWSLLPPAVAIFLALWARQVVVSLFLGVWLGATMLAGDPWHGFLRVVDTNLREALADPDHVSILLFSMLLGGMVAVMSRSGGTAGVVERLEPLATTARRSQIVTWLMGVAIFFDDYSNTLVVGHAMRPVTDRHRVSREKLAFLVDSTAAPVACVAVVSTWVGYQVSVLGDALQAGGSDLNPFSVFLTSVPAAFYPFAALALTLSVAVSRRDMGPMLAAERRAARGALLADRSRPLADFDTTALEPEAETPRRWFNAALPVVGVVFVTLTGLWVTGKAALEADHSGPVGLAEVIGASDPFTVLLWGSLVGLSLAIVLAVAQGLLTVEESMDATVAGFKSMLIAVVVLTLAWSLGRVCTDLGTADWLKEAVGPHLPPVLLPAAVFIVAAAVSFSTGTSWGTIAILTPLAVPLLLRAAPDSAMLLSATVSAILGGSVFGDHCSPISDTTVMSSMASNCDHVDHVRTQLPYALLAAGSALVFGYLPMGVFGLSVWFALPLTIVGVVGLFWLLSRPVDEREPG